jgi:hypothetical protein
MKLAQLGLIALFGAALAAPVFSQPGPGMGSGIGPGKGGGRFAIDNNNTVGWTLMSNEERNTHRQKMWSFKNYDECKTYQLEHHQMMETRAKEQGKAIVPPRFNACDRMKARGVIQ